MLLYVAVAYLWSWLYRSTSLEYSTGFTDSGVHSLLNHFQVLVFLNTTTMNICKNCEVTSTSLGNIHHQTCES